MTYSNSKQIMVVNNQVYIRRDMARYLELLYPDHTVWQRNGPVSALDFLRKMDGSKVPRLAIYGQVRYDGAEGEGGIVSCGEFAEKLKRGPWDDDNMRRVCSAMPLAFAVCEGDPDMEQEGLREMIGAPPDAPTIIRVGPLMLDDLGQVARYYLGKPSENPDKDREIVVRNERRRYNDLSVASDASLLERVLKVVNAGDTHSPDPQ